MKHQSLHRIVWRHPMEILGLIQKRAVWSRIMIRWITVRENGKYHSTEYSLIPRTCKPFRWFIWIFREPTLRHSRSDRDGTRRDGKRPRKRGPKRPPVNNPRLVSGYYSSSQLSSPTGDFDHYETIPNHQSDSNQQDQVMNQDPIFT